jgi:hypothetical protein
MEELEFQANLQVLTPEAGRLSEAEIKRITGDAP